MSLRTSYPPEGGLLAATFLDVRKRIAWLRPARATLGGRNSSALPRDCDARRKPRYYSQKATHRRGHLGSVHLGRVLDSHRWFIDCSRRAVDRLGRQR